MLGGTEYLSALAVHRHIGDVRQRNRRIPATQNLTVERHLTAVERCFDVLSDGGKRSARGAVYNAVVGILGDPRVLPI